MKWIFALILLQATTLDIPASIPRVSMEDVCLSHAVVREAAGESLQGQRAIVDSVRYRASVRGLSICSTLQQPYQYSWWKKGYKFEYNEKFLRILAKAITLPTVVSRADFFHSGPEPYWVADMQYVGRVGNHKFYRS